MLENLQASEMVYVGRLLIPLVFALPRILLLAPSCDDQSRYINNSCPTLVVIIPGTPADQQKDDGQSD